MTSHSETIPLHSPASSLLAALLTSSLMLLAQPIAAQTPATQPSPSIINLQPPLISDYWISATRQAGGAIVFDGYVPDAALKGAFAAYPEANVQWLKLGKGAPEDYRPAVEFGLSLLDHLAEGRIVVRDNVLTLSGTAISAVDYAEISRLTQAAPPTLSVVSSEVYAPISQSYEWVAVKSSTGAIALGGMVPSNAAEQALLLAAGPNTTANLTFASGQPDDFIASAERGIALLARVSDGRVSLKESAWTFTGTALTAQDKAALESDFARDQLAAEGWSMAVAQAPQTANPSISQVDPGYEFLVVKRSSDEMIFSGQLPADPALRFFGAITNGDLSGVAIAPYAPANFIVEAEAGIRALMLMDDGSLEFTSGQWTLSGNAPSTESRDGILSGLESLGSGEWQTDIDIAAQMLAEPAATSLVTAVATPASAISNADCATALAEFSVRNAILFRPGAAIITVDSAPALDELAANLSACPDVEIHVEGHTDADGDAQLNMALSVARAEAVINALMDRGIKPGRLYALGYGETSPISDNETPEGKQLNRRIVVKVSSDL